MKIAQIAPLMESVPPRYYGGTERVVSYLTEELVRQGHEVTLFASGDSRTTATLIPGPAKALRLAQVKDGMPYHLILLDEVCRRAAEFDILHFHIDMLHYPFIRDFAHRTVTTIHGRVDIPDFHPLYLHFHDAPLVAIADHQRRATTAMNWVDRIHHGLPRDLLSRGPGGSYLAFLGRISPEKRPDRAIEIAAKAGCELRIAAKVDSLDRLYWHEKIEPLIRRHPNVTYLGEIADHHKADLLRHAAGLLFPIDWPEPFGLVMIEAMACGTPVIGWAMAAVPEIIEHGVTGFIVDDMSQAVEAVHRLGALDRGRIRAVFEQRFTATRMARDYAALYRRLHQAGLPSNRSLAAAANALELADLHTAK